MRQLLVFTDRLRIPLILLLCVASTRTQVLSKRCIRWYILSLLKFGSTMLRTTIIGLNLWVRLIVLGFARVTCIAKFLCLRQSVMIFVRVILLLIIKMGIGLAIRIVSC